MFLNACRPPSRVRVGRTPQLRKRISIARDSWPIISTPYAAGWMRTRDATETTVNNKISDNRVRKHKFAISETVNGSYAPRASEDKKVNAENRDNKARDNKGNEVSKDRVNKAAASRANKVLKVTSKQINKQVARRTAAKPLRIDNVAASTPVGQSAATGATAGRSPPRFANVCVRRRTCAANGA